MGARGLPVVRDDRRHSHRSAMLQACRACILSVRQGGRLRRRWRFVHCQCVLDPVFRAGAGAWLPCSRLPVVHNHYRHTVRQAVLQNGAACAHAVRCIRAVNGAAARAFCPRALCTRFPAAEPQVYIPFGVWPNGKALGLGACDRLMSRPPKARTISVFLAFPRFSVAVCFGKKLLTTDLTTYTTTI